MHAGKLLVALFSHADYVLYTTTTDLGVIETRFDRDNVARLQFPSTYGYARLFVDVEA